MYANDFGRLIHGLGCLDYRVVSRAPIALRDPYVVEKIGMIEFQSLTVRAFKLDLEDKGENYGQIATYLGTLPQSPHFFTLDDKITFRAGLPVPVSGNTALMLAGTRYRPHFRVMGDRSVHYGSFSSGSSGAASAPPPVAATTGCC